MDAIRWTEGGFRAKRLKTLREVTLPWLWNCIWDPDQADMQRNLDIFAGKVEGTFRGTYWQDELIHKWVEAAVYLLTFGPDQDLEQKIDLCAQKLAEVQKEDGYLVLSQALHNTRFKNPRFHELFDMGHLITAACVHNRITGKRNLLEVAIKAADCMYKEFGRHPEKYPNFSVTKSYIMAVVDLYRLTREQKYLDLANVFIDLHGKKVERRADLHTDGDILAMKTTLGGNFEAEGMAELAGTDIRQTRVPLREETKVVGHAVNFEYLYCSAVDVILETGDKPLLDAMHRLWDDLHETKMAVNGGVNAFQQHLSIRGDKVGEAVGADYDIPNRHSYHETCSQIADCMWGFRLLLLEGQARYADQMELEMFNATIASLGMDGTHWFYINPTKWLGAHNKKDNAKNLGYRYRPCTPPSYSHTCCPTNLSRFEAQMHGYMFTADERGIFIDHYAACTLDWNEWLIEQVTDYPWDGRITVKIKAAPEKSAALRFRIPGWCNGASATLNGEKVSGGFKPCSYEETERVWQTGDELMIELPMEVQLLRAHPKLESCKRQVAVKRGPMVYCLESVDLPEGASVEQVRMPQNPVFTPQWDKTLDAMVLKTELMLDEMAAWDGPLYTPYKPSTPKPVATQMIPYFTWCNRGECEMTCWINL